MSTISLTNLGAEDARGRAPGISLQALGATRAPISLGGLGATPIDPVSADLRGWTPPESETETGTPIIPPGMMGESPQAPQPSFKPSLLTPYTAEDASARAAAMPDLFQPGETFKGTMAQTPGKYINLGTNLMNDVRAMKAVDAEIGAYRRAALGTHDDFAAGLARAEQMGVRDRYMQIVSDLRSDPQLANAESFRERVRSDMGLAGGQYPIDFTPSVTSDEGRTLLANIAASEAAKIDAPPEARTWWEKVKGVTGGAAGFATEVAALGKAGIPGKYAFGVPGAVEAASRGEDPQAAFVRGATTGAAMSGGGQLGGVLGESLGGAAITKAQGGSWEDAATMAAVPLAMRAPGAMARGAEAVRSRLRPGSVDAPIVSDFPRLPEPAPVVPRENVAEPSASPSEALPAAAPQAEPTRAEPLPPAPTENMANPPVAPEATQTRPAVEPLTLARATGYSPEPSPESVGAVGGADMPDPANAIKALKRGAEQFRAPTKRGLEILRRKRGGAAVAEVDVDQLLKEYKAIDSEQRTPEQMHQMHLALRGEADPATLSEPQRAWVTNARAIQDRLSADLIRELQVAYGGETLLTKRIRENIGNYVRETLIPKSAGERVRSLFGRENRLRSEQFKRKRDAWTVVVGRAGYKMSSEADARQLSAELSAGQPTPLIEAAAADHLTSPQTMIEAAQSSRPKVEPPLTEAERIEAGFSRNPMYSAAVSIMDTAHNIEVLRMARTMVRSKVAQNPPMDVLAGGDAALKQWAKDNGLEAIKGDRNRIGVLEGTYAPKRVAEELNRLSEAPKEWQKIWRAYIDAWKTSKTVLNPPTHAHNMLGNLAFADFADVSPMNPGNWKYYRDAVREIRSKGPAYRYLLRQGVIGGEYVGNEVRKLHPMMEGNEPVDSAIIKWGQIGVAKAGKVYNAEDQVYKLAAYLKYRDAGIRGPWRVSRRGASAKAAAREVNMWFPNYGTVSKPFKVLSRTPVGGPFLSFFEQATRIAGRAAVRRPLTVAKWLMMPHAMTVASAALLGMQDDERKLIDADRSYFEPLIPWRDSKGAAGTLDLRYTIPLAQEATNAYEFATGRRHSADLPFFMQQAPVEAAIDITRNQQSFTRQQVYADDDTLLQKAGKSALHAIHTAAPYPTFLDYGRERLQRAFKGVSDESVPRAIAGAVLGIGVRKPFIGRDEAFSRLKAVAMDDPKVKQVVDRLLVGDVSHLDYDALTRDLEKNERFQDLLDLYNEVYRRDVIGPYMDRGKLGVGERIVASAAPYGPSKADQPATERGVLSSMRRDVSKQQAEAPTERVTLRKHYEGALKDLRRKARLAKERTGPRLSLDERRALRTMEAYDRAINGWQKRLQRRGVNADRWDEGQKRIDEYMTKALRAAGIQEATE